MSNQQKQLLLAVAMTTVVFCVDLFVELGVATAIPYVAIVWLAYLARSERGLWVAASVCTMLAIIGFFLSPAGGEIWKVIVNRVLSVVVIWLTAMFCWQVLRLLTQQKQFIEKQTADLAEANKLLEQSKLDLQQFAYVASHDLQTPLRGIAGLAQILRSDYQGKFDEQADDYIERIVDGAIRMQDLINDLLAYSRVESRAGPHVETDLSEVLDDTLALLGTSIEDTGVEVTRNKLPNIVCERSQVTQLLQNLIENGIKYHGDEPPKIDVSAERSDGHWTIAVHDNGIGIPEKHHEQIFEIFRRLHTAEDYPGTGIGLAVCKRIVGRHGGKIWLESKPGCGSTFYFTVDDGDTEA